MSKDGRLTAPDSRATAGDVIHSMAVKAGLGSVPLVGPFLSEAVQLAIVSPAQRRTQEFLEQVANAINALEQRGISATSLANDEGFQDVVFAAIESGRRSASSEKRTRLLACVANSAVLDAPAERKRLFIRLVDELDASHFVVLKIYGDKLFGVDAGMVDMSDDKALERLAQLVALDGVDREYLALVLRDLNSRGLLTNDYRAGTRLASSNFQRMIISLVGRELLEFVTEPAG
ncbi:hypothetical protein EYV96_05315 [Dyella terrae]|nr:hypothetical protein [Dyella soli]TBR39620.1 hypothetical protein EYV96_05315 [Dyella terrae]